MQESAIVSWRDYLIATVLAAALGVVLLSPPIPQDPAYHAFADTRSLLGIPNVFNVLTNLVFLLVGALGVRACIGGHCGDRAPRAWLALFLAVALVSAGSGYYHVAPDNNGLVWDRLPMSMGFMALITAIAAEYIDTRLEKILLVPALLLGLASVIYWHYSGDLRLYVWVQFAPLLAIPAIMLLYKSAYTHARYLAIALLVYGIAKIAEYFDAGIYRTTEGIISGHSLKHLLAAFALYFVYRMLHRRAPVPVGGSPS